MAQRIAVIGSGISGLSAAWLLSKHHHVTVFDKADRIGGHVNTMVAQTRDGEVPVDTGFIVYNERNYPNFSALLGHLGVETAPSCMSFAVSLDEGAMEYAGAHITGLFGQKRNIVRIEHWRLVSDILRFFREAEKSAASLPDSVGIGDFLISSGYSRQFIDDHILPVSAAIWSTPSRSMMDFPARTFIAFFANHGLLKVVNRPQWRTVRGGARSYVARLLAERRFSSLTGQDIVAVERGDTEVTLRFADGSARIFDNVIMACPPGTALSLMADANDAERAVLGAFGKTTNRAVLHSDASYMPQRRHLWSAWNYLRSGPAGEESLSLTYWMNRLQPLGTKTDLFVTLNPERGFAPGTVQAEVDYDHPLFDVAAINAQKQLWQVQGRRRTWFAGAWMGYGFHEDGLQAGLEVAERIGPATRPWTAPAHRGRIAHNWAGEERTLWAAE
jgi:predicted NAD/FAD-binding protein